MVLSTEGKGGGAKWGRFLSDLQGLKVSICCSHSVVQSGCVTIPLHSLWIHPCSQYKTASFHSFACITVPGLIVPIIARSLYPRVVQILSHLWPHSPVGYDRASHGPPGHMLHGCSALPPLHHGTMKPLPHPHLPVPHFTVLPPGTGKENRSRRGDREAGDSNCSCS